MKKALLPPTNMVAEAKASSKGHALWLEIIFFILVFFVGQAAVSIPVTVAAIVAVFSSDAFRELMAQVIEGAVVSDAAIAEFAGELMGAMPDWVMLVQLFATAFATVITILYCRYLEKRPLSSMGLRRGHILREYGIGALIGILLISLCVGFCLLTGALTLQAADFSPVMWILFLIGFVMQGMSEEVVCRGFMMISVSRRHALWLAVLTNSVTFGLLHLGNPGFGLLPMLNIVLFGILESVYVLKRGDLWGACAIHSLWNFFQGNVFGISVSGTGMIPSPLRATFTPGHELFNGGNFGLEGGLAVTLIITVVTLLMLFFLPTKKEEIAPLIVPCEQENEAIEEA